MRSLAASCAATAACLVATAALGHTAAGEASGLTLHDLLRFLHIVLFVFWLGPDFGVYLWSRQAAGPGLLPEQRWVAGLMMGRVELIGRVSMALMLTVGGLLSEHVGLTHPWWQMAGIILLGPVWLTLVLVAWFRDGTPLGGTARNLDTALRWVLVVAVPVSVIYSTVTGRLAVAPYVGSKLLLFAAIVFLSIQLRARLRPFEGALGRFRAGEDSEQLRQLAAGSIRRSQPYLFGIWILLLVAAWLGVVQPGAAPAG